MRPGVAERLGVGPDECLAREPAARLRTDDRLGAGRPGRRDRRARHHLRRRHRRARRERAAVRPADAAAQPARRLRRAPPTWSSGLLAALHCVARVRGRAGRRRRDGRQHRAPHHDVPRAARRRRVDRPARAPTCSTAARRSTARTAPVDGGWMAVGALESAFYDELLDRLGIDATDGDRTDPTRWPELARADRRRLRHPHARRVDRSVRRHRRVRGAGAVPARGPAAAAPRRARDVRRARRRRAAGAGTAVQRYAYAPGPAAAGAPASTPPRCSASGSAADHHRLCARAPDPPVSGVSAHS